MPATPGFPILFPGITLEGTLAVIITLIFIWWAVFTLVALYHWFRYARDSWLAVPVFLAHLAISSWIFVFAIGGFN